MRHPKIIKVIERIFLLSCIAGLSVVLFAQSAKPADWLTDGGDIERTAWQHDETLLCTATVKNMKLLWKTKLDNEPRQMHNLLPVLIAGRVTTANGPKQIVLARASPTISTRWMPTTARSSGSIISTPIGYLRWAVAARDLVPGRHHGDAGDWADRDARQIHRVCRGLGWHVAPLGFGDGQRDQAAREIHAAERQALRAEFAQQRDLRAHGARLRRQSEHGLHLRSGDGQSRIVGAGGRRHVGTHRRRDYSKGVMYTGTGDGPWNPENGVYGNGIIGVAQDPVTKGGEADGLLRPVERRMACGSAIWICRSPARSSNTKAKS